MPKNKLNISDRYKETMKTKRKISGQTEKKNSLNRHCSGTIDQNERHPTILASFAGNYKKCTRVKSKHISKRTISTF